MSSVCAIQDQRRSTVQYSLDCPLTPGLRRRAAVTHTKRLPRYIALAERACYSVTPLAIFRGC